MFMPSFSLILFSGVFIDPWPQSWFAEFNKMGKALAKLFGKKDMRILMLGLDAAGKTSILVHFSVCVCVCECERYVHVQMSVQ